ncbi:MAG TPA: 50S ribosomal protein L25 [Candidatus Paceibacterota bacterium]|nr:50S ribosomal protein L25 [Candidatus Paceibacterota bacterium]
MQTLTATKRSKAEKLETMRNNGMIPGVVYGARVENTPISVPSVLFGKVLKEAGESSTIVLDLANKKIDVLIHDVQVDPVKGQPIHVDFLAIDMNKSIQVKVPVEFIGIAPGEKSGLGVLVKVLHEITIEALPKDLPHSVTVDISTLVNLNDQVHVKDIKFPKGVTAITGGDEVVGLLAAVKEEVVEEVAAPVDLSAIEVEKKGKQEEENPVGEEKGEDNSTKK